MHQLFLFLSIISTEFIELTLLSLCLMQIELVKRFDVLHT